MTSSRYDRENIDIAWCPGCGNFSILKTLKQAFTELDLPPERTVLVSGIGQAAKTPHYIGVNYFDGLHGRALPPATAIKVTNPDLVVIAESGDGDTYGEGGNHFIHTIRRNPDIAHIVHNNMVYGLTKGQASPTSQHGFKTPVQPLGVGSDPFNPLAVAIALDASFVARTFAGDQQLTKELVKKAIQHKGYALLDVFQPCVTFNKINTYAWFKEKCYNLDETHDPTDRNAAFGKALETERLPLGIFYLNPGKTTFEDNIAAQIGPLKPLHRHTVNLNSLQHFIESRKSA